MALETLRLGLIVNVHFFAPWFSTGFSLFWFVRYHVDIQTFIEQYARLAGTDTRSVWNHRELAADMNLSHGEFHRLYLQANRLLAPHGHRLAIPARIPPFQADRRTASPEAQLNSG